MGYRCDLQARYADTHAWARLEGELAVIGISDYAQQQLSDLMWVELPRIGAVVAGGDPIIAIESVKASGDAYSPISGVVVEVNTALEAKPDLVNHDPYGQGWLAKLRPSRPEELTELMDAPAYEAFILEEEKAGRH